MGADGRMEDARKVWATIDQQGWEFFSQRDVYQCVRRSYIVEKLSEVLDTLTSMVYTRTLADAAVRSVGHPSSRWEVNPYDRTQYTQLPTGALFCGSGGHLTRV